MKFNSLAIKIIFVSFFAPAIIQNLNTLFSFLLAEILNVKCIFTFSGLGTLCGIGNDALRTTLLLHVNSILALFFSITGFLIAKFYHSNKSKTALLIGSLLFYSAIRFAYFVIVNSIPDNFVVYLSKNKDFYNKPLSFFGNYFNAQIFFISVEYLTFIVVLFLGFKIVFSYWNKEWRIKFFTFGLISCFLGNLFWYFFLGQIIYGKGIYN